MYIHFKTKQKKRTKKRDKHRSIRNNSFLNRVYYFYSVFFLFRIFNQHLTETV